MTSVRTECNSELMGQGAGCRQRGRVFTGKVRRACS